ncbi:hypothetical protein ACFLQ6_09810 [Thermoproteota archaeon]
MSYKIFLFAILMVCMVSAISQNAHATITSITLEPECGPPGTDVILIVRFTEGSNIDVEFSPDIIAGGDIGDDGMSLYFTVPEGVYSIKITITEDGIPVKVLTFTYCSTVGGVPAPTNKLEILTPYIVLAGLIAAVSTVYVINRRKD